MLKMIEKSTIKEIPMSLKDIKTDSHFWIVDYPILAYVKRDGREIEMIHLADPDFPRKSYMLERGEEFIAFVDQAPKTGNASIMFLLDLGQKISLKNLKYIKPYEKKEFTNDTYWSESS